MINLDRPTEPNYLVNNKVEWTQTLLGQINNLQDISKVPEKYIKHYRDVQITENLFRSSNNKCAYCERKPSDGGGFLEVDHFFYKDRYPERCFEWTNLIPCCKNCNTTKGKYDCGEIPIIDPYIDNPDEYLTYNLIEIEVRSNASNIEKGECTLKVLNNLNNDELITLRSELLVAFTSNKNKLSQKIIEFQNSQRNDKKTRIINEMRDFVFKMEQLDSENSILRGYIRFLIKDCNEFQDAKRIISEFDNSTN